MNTTRWQSGLSLVELMISITLGLLLMTGVTGVFLSNKQVFSTQKALSRIQETGRLGIEFLAKDIRMAGYMGCGSRNADFTVTNTLNNSANYLYAFDVGIQGYSDATTNTGPNDAGINPAPGTDFVVVRGVFDNGVRVTRNNNGGQLFAEQTTNEAGVCDGDTNRVSGICRGDILMVANCARARVFQATNVAAAGGEVNIVHSAGGTASPGNEKKTASWGGQGGKAQEQFGEGSEILKVRTIAYYIAQNTAGRLALYKNVDGVDLELMENVEDLVIEYRIDTSTDFDAAGDIDPADWGSVVAVRLSFVVASAEDNVVEEPQTYTINGTAVIPVDRRLRQVFTTTVGVRGRSL